MHFFGGADLGPQPPVNATSETVMPGSPVQVQGMDDRAAAAAASIDLAIDEIVALVNKLRSVRTKVPSDRENAKSLVTIGSRLKTFLHLVTATGYPLPEKENIGPNQYSWPETAARMGVKRGNKRRVTGKVDSGLTAQHIGEPNRKRPADNDPYCYAPSFIFVSCASLSHHVYYRPVPFDLPDYFGLCRYLDI